VSNSFTLFTKYIPFLYLNTFKNSKVFDYSLRFEGFKMYKGLLVLCLLMCNRDIRSMEEDLIQCRVIAVGQISVEQFQDIYLNDTLDTIPNYVRDQLYVTSTQETSSPLVSESERQPTLARSKSISLGQGDSFEGQDSNSALMPGSTCPATSTTPDSSTQTVAASVSRSTRQTIHDRVAQYALSSAVRASVTPLILSTSVGQEHPELVQRCTAVVVDVVLAATRDDFDVKEVLKIGGREVVLGAICCATQSLMPKMPIWMQRGCRKVNELAVNNPGVWILRDVIPRALIDTCIKMALS
jgi:hypothetical protein